MSPKERPILFSAPMVRAILEGRKTQTRRVVKPGIHVAIGHDWEENPDRIVEQHDPEFGSALLRYVACPYGVPGDGLWVKETFQGVYDCQDWDCECRDNTHEHRRAVYRATEPDGISGFCRSWEDEREAIWKPSIFMPRWASRITLEVTGVRVERLGALSDEDGRAEGYSSAADFLSGDWARGVLAGAPWAHAPWVWAISFKRIEAKSEAA